MNRCPDCDGSGETQAVYHDDPCLVPGVQVCESCGGTGEFIPTGPDDQEPWTDKRMESVA